MKKTFFDSFKLPQGCKPCGTVEEVNWEAFELRNWDGRLARWTSIDPAGQFHSPYLGMGNNPVNAIDPDGGWIKGAGFFRNLFQSDRKILTDMGGILTESSDGFTITKVNSSASLLPDGTTSITLRTTQQFFPKGRGIFSNTLEKLADQKAYTFGLAGNAALVGGIGFEFGVGVDSYGRVFGYNSEGVAFGADLSIGLELTVNKSLTGRQMSASDLRGDGGQISVSAGNLDFSLGGEMKRTFGPFGTFGKRGVNNYRSVSFGGSIGSPAGITFQSLSTSVTIW